MTTSEVNSASSADKKADLPRANILRGRKNFQRLFSRKAHVLHQANVDLRFLLVDDHQQDCLMAFIAKKSLAKAHERNRLKRLLRETYRRRQHIIDDMHEQAGDFSIHGAFMAKSTAVDFEDVKKDVAALLEELVDCLPRMATHSV